jgi:DNA polymerase (family X)
MMSINPDAHSTDEIDLTHWGVEMARKGGVPSERVLNCLDLRALTGVLEKRRRSRSAKRAGPKPSSHAATRSTHADA